MIDLDRALLNHPSRFRRLTTPGPASLRTRHTATPSRYTGPFDLLGILAMLMHAREVLRGFRGRVVAVVFGAVITRASCFLASMGCPARSAEISASGTRVSSSKVPPHHHIGHRHELAEDVVGRSLMPT